MRRFLRGPADGAAPGRRSRPSVGFSTCFAERPRLRLRRRSAAHRRAPGARKELAWQGRIEPGHAVPWQGWQGGRGIV